MIKNPLTDETYELGEEEFFLCQAIDGNSATSDIIQKFNQSFGHTLTEEHFEEFVKHIEQLGLFDHVENNDNHYSTGNHPIFNGSSYSKNLESSEERLEPDDELSEVIQKGRFQLPLFNPNNILPPLISLILPIRIIFPIISWCLIGLTPISLITFFRNETEFFLDASQTGNVLSFIGQFLFALFFINGLTRIVQCFVIAYYGGTVREISMTLRFGIFPQDVGDPCGALPPDLFVFIEQPLGQC